MGNQFEKPPGQPEKPKVINCPVCGGSGKDKETKPCKRCDGSGKVRDN